LFLTESKAQPLKPFTLNIKPFVSLVTGANAGIGYHTALGLARQGYEVVMLCRSAERGEEARQQIILASGNEAVHLLKADLASLADIRRAAGEFLGRFDRLDVLVNNAGLVRAKREETVDGFEMTFAVNHLAYFLLTHLLLDRLKAAAPARIVNVSSNAHLRSRFDFDDIDRIQRFAPYGVYAQSKLANVWFTRALARRLEGTGVTVNALHPGVVRTNIAGSGWHPLAVAFRFLGRFYLTPEQGAETSIFLASSPDVAGVTGQYFNRKKSVRAAPSAYNDEDAERLWRISAEMVGIDA
jgi:NAD(P)-dependent dehydrogenase (short-subunit alcohol dehydrogenase family)